jgi:hypothetical protein
VTRAPEPNWIVLTHAPGPREFWRTLIQTPDEAKAMQEYKNCIVHWPSEGGVRLLNPKGITIRHAGTLGKQENRYDS